MRADHEPLCDFRYEYDLNGNRTAKAGICLFPGEEHKSDTVISYRYDLCGNRMEKESVAERETYRYNKKNQMTERTGAKGITFYQYDLQGNLTEECGSDISGITNIDLKNSIADSGFKANKVEVVGDLKDEVLFQSADDGNWYSLSGGNMSHKNTVDHKDAVTAWNDELYQYGPKSEQAREYMKDPDNYYIETDFTNVYKCLNLKGTIK